MEQGVEQGDDWGARLLEMLPALAGTRGQAAPLAGCARAAWPHVALSLRLPQAGHTRVLLCRQEGGGKFARASGRVLIKHGTHLAAGPHLQSVCSPPLERPPLLAHRHAETLACAKLTCANAATGPGPASAAGQR